MPVNEEVRAKVVAAMSSGRKMASFQIAAEIGESIRAVGGVLAPMVKSGQMFHVGEMPISKSREVNVFCIHEYKPEAVVIPTTKPTWLAALGVV